MKLLVLTPEPIDAAVLRAPSATRLKDAEARFGVLVTNALISR